ncbi:YncE family protein [Nocardia sp. NPDC005998]|uniref:YncE family protein n=1 Tax=Nocardia sp. NPDC005998 TaxID=3156894 RepID=UPI0033ACA532
MRPTWPMALTCAIVMVATGCGTSTPPQPSPLPLHLLGQLDLPGAAVRFDYMSLDAGSGLLWVAHMGAGAVVEIDIRAHRVVRTIADLPDVHGVLAVPQRHRIFATATGRNQLATIDSDSGTILRTSPTGDYPDGLAYDPRRDAVWTTNQRAGTETVIDAETGTVRGTVPLGGEVGNVVYDSDTDRMVVAVQGRADLAVIDPQPLTVIDRIPVPGCAGPHGQALDAADRLMFVGCEDNAHLVTVDLTHRTVIDANSVGRTPDVLVYDDSAHRLYVAAESGWVSIFDQRAQHTIAIASDHLAEGAHTVAVDPDTHHSFFPLPKGQGGGPVLLEFEPST